MYDVGDVMWRNDAVFHCIKKGKDDNKDNVRHKEKEQFCRFS